VNTELVAATPEGVERAARLLGEGGLVAFPTETVYGLGARADDDAALRALYTAKGRPESKALIVHVADIAAARAVVRAWPEQAQQLAEHYWPGPLTLVLPKAAGVPDTITAGGDTVAVRAPAHPVSIQLLAACDFSLAAPSANRSGEPPPHDAEQVVASLGGRIPFVLDGGRCPVGTPSTIVDLCPLLDGGSARVLRDGAVPRDELCEHLPLA
jgi:L-threonylcarbamoyladenylate synthase